MEENLEAAMANYNDDSLRTIEGLKHIRFRQGLWPMNPPRLACKDVEQEIQDVAAVQHHFLDSLDLRFVSAPVQKGAIVLIVDRITGNVEDLLL